MPCNADEDAIYVVDRECATAGERAVGPWDRSLQHGAAPAALVAWALETIPAARAAQVARLTIDLLRPVPVAPLSIHREVIRAGRKIDVSLVRLMANGVEVVRASALRVRVAERTLPGSVVEPALDVARPEACPALTDDGGIESPFLDGISMRTARDRSRTTGSAATWYRADRPIVAGVATSPLMRAAIAADFCNGTSRVLPFRDWTFVNADVTVSLARMPIGEWILLDAESWLGPSGAGIAFARLGDVRGYFGRAVQSLVIEPR